jgi:glycosyltransferase involved in cell wall biosynthesis
MRARAEQLRLGDRVIFAGAVHDMPRLYAAADIFVFPSRYEAFGLALLEAMAAGLPSVVSRAGGLMEVASPEGSVMIDSERSHELARAVVRLGRDAELRASMGAAAAAHAERFDVARRIPRLMAVYERL